jgi:phosphate butyryltransferase
MSLTSYRAALLRDETRILYQFSKLSNKNKLALNFISLPDKIRKFPAWREIMKSLICVNPTEHYEAMFAGLKDIKIIKTNADGFDAATDAVFAADDTPVFMKGLIESSDFMRLILRRSDLYEKGNLLSHCGIVPNKFIFTDGALNMYPDAAAKAKIARNAIWLHKKIHGEDSRPKISALTPAGKPNLKIQSSIDAEFVQKELADIADVELDQLDTAVSAKAMQAKGRAARPADILLCHDLDSGNILYKSLIWFGGFSIAGLVVGAKFPICLNSRSDSLESKLLSVETAIKI